jgi:hypothetical protein
MSRAIELENLAALYWQRAERVEVNRALLLAAMKYLVGFG